MNAIDALKAEVGYAEAEPALKRVIGVYRSLQTLEKQARLKPAVYLAKYRALLTRSIAQVKTSAETETPLDSDSDIVKQWFTAFTAWLEERWREFGIAKKQAKRYPRNLYAWVEQHYPAIYKQRQAAEERADKHLTIRNLELLKASELALLKTYRDAIDGEGRAD
jgi:hypothetical protein